MAKLKTQEQFIKEAKAKHNGFYTYEKVIYVRALHKVLITCPVHGDFLQTANEHLKGYKCVNCAGNNIKLTIDIITEKALKIHGNKYDYTLIDYKGNKKKVKIICKIHGVWEQTINDHLGGHGCPKCNSFKKSGVEKKLFNNLKKEFFNIDIVSQGKTKWLNSKFKDNYSFDIYLPEYNIAIEYQGKQHFESVPFYNGDLGLLKTQNRDKYKRSLCNQNGCKLFYFTYTTKDVPADYPHKVYTDEQELIKEIKKYI